MPVIAMSGAQAPTSIRSAADSGKLSYVMKPVDTSSLVRLIDRMLGDTGVPAPRPKASSE